VKAPTSARQKLLTQAEVARRVARARRRGERVVFTSGCFDLLHVGHLRSLEEARRQGDRLVVGVNSDASVRRIKGAGRPIVSERQRAELLAALACVDSVVVFAGATPRALISRLMPDVYAKGGDWPLATLRRDDLPEGFQGRIHRLRQIPGFRTTRTLGRIRRNPSAPQRRPTD